MTLEKGPSFCEKDDKSTNVEETNLHKRRASVWSCDFESAIAAAGFGKFNAYLVIVAAITGLIAAFEGRAMAYIVPAAQCDLHININQKAMLSCIPFVGMVTTTFLWGLMGDLMGRKKIIIIICSLDFICWIMSAFAQSFVKLLVSRLLGGMVSSGIYASLASYITETHGVKHRAVMQLFLGNIFGIGDLLLPIMALGILTNNEIYKISSIVIHPWNSYVLICSLLPFLSALGFFLLPESPKFLMSKSQNDQAINVFQSIYSLNTNKNNKLDYPVKSLKRISKNTDNLNTSPQNEATNGCISQIALFCEHENLKNICLAVFSQFFIIMGLNSVLLWVPQIFQEMSNRQKNHNRTATFCETMYDLCHKTNDITDNCEEDMSGNINTYVYCMVVALATIILFIISGFIVNTIGKHKLLYILGICSAISTVLLILADGIFQTLLLTAIICAFGNIGFNALVAIVADIFPTNLRAMSVSLTMMLGRLGGAIGPFIFPVFLTYGCLQALLFIAALNLVWIVLVYQLPHIENSETSKNSEE